ncbi:MAG: hypothetical protein K2L55_10470 [Muribaculaceae bacterium]|nr:hypothetical protein [Muribaculaceae bacterium]
MKKTDNIRVKQFAKSIIEAYGYTFQVPSREIAKELKSVCYITVMRYLAALEQDGYLTSEMTSRKHGKRYKFNRYKVDRLLMNKKSEKDRKLKK